MPADWTLRPVTAPDAAIIGGWSRSAEETDRWCSSKVHPVSAERILGWWEADDVEPWVLVSGEDGLPIAYGELWLDAEEDEAELARLIVDPEMRGRGIGKGLVRALSDRAAVLGFRTQILRVKPGNESALGAYRASGFRDVDPVRGAEWNEGQPEQYVWLELLS